MPDYKPNQIIRAFAVMALIAAFVLVVVIIATSGGGSGGNDNGNAQKPSVSKSRPEGPCGGASGSSIRATRSALSP